MILIKHLLHRSAYFCPLLASVVASLFPLRLKYGKHVKKYEIKVLSTEKKYKHNTYFISSSALL